jgi:hypothetical protein
LVQNNAQRLVTGFASVSYRQNGYGLAVIAIERQITALTERDEPFSELRWHLIDWPPDLGVPGKRLRALTNGAHGSPCRIGILRRQEVMKPLDVM